MMALRRTAGVTLALALLAGATCASGEPGGKKEERPMTSGPFEIRLSVKGRSLKAVLVNRSQSAQRVFYDPLLQPSQLELRGAGGKVEAFDSRSLMKFDNTFHCSRFKQLRPGGELALGSAELGKKGGGFAGKWDPFEFEDLPGGEYTARAIWSSEASSCTDDETGQVRPLPDVWLGRVESNPVTLALK